MLNYKQVRFLEPDVERIRREFRLGTASYARLFALLQQHHAEREGKPRWGDQTGLIERYADQVIAAYPGAKVIHMLRDPRDRYAGSLQLWPDGKGRAGGAAARWLYTTRLARRNARLYPQRYLVVRFEDLVREPDVTLQAVCAFLDEPYYPGMLAMDGAPEQREKMIRRSHGNPDASPLSSEYIGIYRGQVPVQELAFLQLILRDRMRAYGYDLEPLHLNAKQRRGFLLKTLPLNLGRMAAWQAQEAAQQLFPSRFGRRPSAHMRVEPAGQTTALTEGEG